MIPVHATPWWYRLAERHFPERCREIPEATDPTGKQIVLRQVALFGRYLYLQQFASSENMSFMHSHQWHRTFALGLWGSYTEKRLAGHAKRRRAPYFYTMGADVVHHVQLPSEGHTSLFLGLWRDDDLKHSYPAHAPGKRLWSDHIRVMVKRI